MICTADSFRGQQRVRGLLERYLAAGRLGGTLLLLGQRGLGKTTLAAIIARALTCENNREQPRLHFCGECYACRSIASGNQPEYVYVRPKTKEITVTHIEDEFEGLRTALMHPTLLSHRIFILDDAHYLNEETGNQLLKLFEESPDRTVFILVTDKPELLLPTIHSRGQKFALAPEPVDTLTSWLAEDMPECPADHAREAALMSAGRYVDAVELAGDASWRGAVRELAARLFKGRDVLPAAKKLAEAEQAMLWRKEQADTGLSEDELTKAIENARKNELRRIALVTAYDRASWWALQSAVPPPGYLPALSLLKQRINQNINEELAQTAFEVMVAHGLSEPVHAYIR